MAGFMDILGTLVQQGLSQSSGSRIANALGAGQSSGGLGDIVGSLGQMLGGGQATQAGGASLGGLGGVLGEVLGGLGNNKAALGGLGALAGALLGGGRGATRGAIGGGGLAMLAALAMSALKKAGQSPSSTPQALLEPQTPEDEAALEQEAEIIVKAMINAAKADGQIDDTEIKKILGKLQEDGLTEEEKELFLTEANKPLDLEEVIASAQGRPELAAQIYSASLLAIEVDTPAEQQYMQELATGLGLDPLATSHIEQILGMQQA